MSLSNKDNSIKKAVNLSELSSSLSRKGSVGRQDKVDFFKFSVTGQKSFSATLTKLKENVDLALLNGQGTVIARSQKPGKKAEAINTVLDGGTFYLQVKSRTARPSTPYRLTLVATPVTEKDDRDTGDHEDKIIKVALSKIVDPAELGQNFIASGDTAFFSTQVESYSSKLFIYKNGSVKAIGTSDIRGFQAIYGDRAVFSSLLNSTGTQLFLYDGTTTKQLTNSSQKHEFLGLDSTRAFWIDDSGTATSALYMYDGAQTVMLGNGIIEPLVLKGRFQASTKTPNLSGSTTFLPDLVNTSLTWKAPGGSDGGSDTELFVFDGDLGKVVQLTANNSNEDYFGVGTGKIISKNNIIFADDNKYCLYEIGTGKIRAVSSDTNIRISFASGENVIYYTPDNQYFLFNGSTTQKLPIEPNELPSGLGTSFTLSDSNVAFRKKDGITDSEIFFYNAKTGQSAQITQRPGIDPLNTINEQILYQDGANVFWSNSLLGDNIYVSNGITGERKELTSKNVSNTLFVGPNMLWVEGTSLFFYNGTTGQKAQLSNNWKGDFADYTGNIYGEPKFLSSSHIGWQTIDGKSFLYDIAANTTTQLTSEGYMLKAVSGSNALLVRNSDNTYFYTK